MFRGLCSKRKNCHYLEKEGGKLRRPSHKGLWHKIISHTTSRHVDHCLLKKSFLRLLLLSTKNNRSHLLKPFAQVIQIGVCQRHGQ